MKEKGILNIRELIKGIAITCSYPLLVAILAVPFSLLADKKSISLQVAYLFVYFILFLIYGFMFLKELKKDFNDFKKNYKSYLLKALKIWLIGLLIMIVSSLVFSYFKIGSNANQDANADMLKRMPIFEIISAIIFAPMIEELVYRKSFKDFTSNKHLFALITGLIFASSHVLSSISSINDIIMLVYYIPFGALGIAFGYIYKETNNIWSSIIIHSLHNALSIIELLFLI